MTILSMNRKELEKSVGKVDEKLQKTITDMGTPIEYINDAEVAIEVFPNRPDLLSLGNFARAVNQYRGKGKLTSFRLNEPEKDYEVFIDKSVKGVRDHTICCIAKGLKFDDEKIKEIIDLQEKMHNSLGRGRKKAAIGIYPLERIELPISYKALDPVEVKFRPLDFPKELNARQILSRHPTGREYGDLLKDKEKFPFFFDAQGKVLSMPPIINSEETGRITQETKEIFIECSGDNIHYLKKIMNIIVSTLVEMGAKVYKMKINDKKEGSFSSPQMERTKMVFDIEMINKNIGIELSEKEIKKHLARMDIEYVREGQKSIAMIPAYRTDILHPIDLVEEVAICYGYDNLEPIIPEISTIAEEDEVAKKKRMIANVLAGAGLLETFSFHLTTKKDIKKIYFDMLIEDMIEVEESKTQRDTLRNDLLTTLMQVLSDNSDSVYPQKIFEMGKTFDWDESKETKINEKEKLAVAMADEKVTFTEIRQTYDYLLRMFDLKAELKEATHPAFITGRCAKVEKDGKVLGYLGEVAPRVLKNWKIKVPVVAMEIDMKIFND